MLSSSQLSILKDNFIYDEKLYQFYDHHWHHVDMNNIKIYIRDHFSIQMDSNVFDRRFFQKPFNKDPNHLICFKNGVYDFKSHQFRDGLPSDGCTLCTNYNYVPTYNNELWQYLHKVFPDTEDYIQFMKTMNQLFKGDPRLIYGYSTCNNGISTLYRLIDMMYGSYGLNVQPSQLEQRRPLLEYLNQKFKGRYLRFTGYADDKLYKLYKSVTTFTSILTSIDETNQLKSISCESSELKFKSKFLNNGINHKYNYPIDFNLTKQLSSFALTLMTKLINLQDADIRYLYFNQNNIFVQDINHYILTFYLKVMYL